MRTSNKQSLLWLVVLVMFVVGVSYMAVTILAASQFWLTNIMTVSCLVSGIVLLSLFIRIQQGEYAYPMWCVFIIIIALGISCQLFIRYWDSLLVNVLGAKYYWSIMITPNRIYLLTVWVLFPVLAMVSICWLLLKITKRVVIFGFYELAIAPVLLSFSAWVIGLDAYQAPALLKVLAMDLASYWHFDELSDWFIGGIVIMFILIKIIVAVLYRQRWIVDIHRLVWVAIVIWTILLLINPALVDLKKVLANHLNAVGILISYYFLVIAVSLSVFQLFYKSNNHKALFLK